MRKFTMIYLAILILFIGFGTFFIFFGTPEEAPEIDESLINKTPGLQTMLNVEKILSEQQLDQSLMNIEVNPTSENQSIKIELQGNDFVSEDILLKDSYNILSHVGKLNEVNEVSIHWFSKVAPDNGEVLVIKMTKEQIAELQQHPYTSIPQQATEYVKHENLN